MQHSISKTQSSDGYWASFHFMMWERKEGNSDLCLFADSKFLIHELPPHQNPKVVLENNVFVLF